MFQSSLMSWSSHDIEIEAGTIPAGTVAASGLKAGQKLAVRIDGHILVRHHLLAQIGPLVVLLP